MAAAIWPFFVPREFNDHVTSHQNLTGGRSLLEGSIASIYEIGRQCSWRPRLDYHRRLPASVVCRVYQHIVLADVGKAESELAVSINSIVGRRGQKRLTTAFGRDRQT
jgi:hypothetical protein